MSETDDEQYVPDTDTVRYYATYGNWLSVVEFDRWLAKTIREAVR